VSPLPYQESARVFPSVCVYVCVRDAEPDLFTYKLTALQLSPVSQVLFCLTTLLGAKAVCSVQPNNQLNKEIKGREYDCSVQFVSVQFISYQAWMVGPLNSVSCYFLRGYTCESCEPRLKHVAMGTTTKQRHL
jgi:hypothetical protein